MSGGRRLVVDATGDVCGEGDRAAAAGSGDRVAAAAGGACFRGLWCVGGGISCLPRGVTFSR